MIELEVVPGNFWIYIFHRDAEIPEFSAAEFLSITKTDEEISIVTTEKLSCEFEEIEKDWRCMKVKGLLDFSFTGILNDILSPLKDKGISVFVISTFNTDYIFIKDEKLMEAVELLKSDKNLILLNRE